MGAGCQGCAVTAVSIRDQSSGLPLFRSPRHRHLTTGILQQPGSSRKEGSYRTVIASFRLEKASGANPARPLSLKAGLASTPEWVVLSFWSPNDPFPVISRLRKEAPITHPTEMPPGEPPLQIARAP